MRVPFVFGPDDLRLREVDRPRVGPRDVVLQVAIVGICGSDLGYIKAGGVAGPAKQPMPLGHELSGIVCQVGAEVRSAAIGDRVVVNPLVNLIGNGGPEGGFGEYLLVRDVAGKPGSLLRLPDTLSLEVGALVEPLAVAAHGVHRLGAEAGDKVAIFGAGPIGLAAVVILRQRGVEQIVVFDPSPFRRDRAERLGASAAFDPFERAPVMTLKDVHGSVRVFREDAPQTSHFIEASGAPVLPDIVGFARAGATICVLSVQKDLVGIDFRQVMTKELTLTGALGYPTELDDVIALLQQSSVDLDAMVSHRFEARDVMAAFETARQPDRAAKVLVRYGSADN